MIGRTISLYKMSFTGLSRESWLLSFIMLINRSGTMVLPFMTLYLTGKEMNRSLSEAGFVMALFGLGSIVGAYFGGKFSDKIGFYKVQLIALLGGGMMFMILGQLTSYPLICISTFLLSLVNEAFRPANSSAIAFYSNAENRTRSYSLNRLSINLGWAVGASMGGLIAAYDYQLLFWVDGITNLLAAGLLFVFLKPAVQKKKIRPSSEVPEKLSAYKDKTYLSFLIYMTLFSLCFVQLFSTIPKYFRDNLFLNEKYIGLMMAVNGIIIVAIEMVMVYTLEKKNRGGTYIILGVIMCAISYLALLLPGNPKLIALVMILFISFGEILAMPFMTTFWIQRTTDQNRGQYAGLYTISWGLGNTLGPFIFSALIDASNFKVAFVVLGFLLITSAYGFYRVDKIKS
ncbi:MAG: major facilitator superfamily 1 [Bacteroidota bacterium]|jgi:predicted MFS family arabinose efflux permease|nr:major facilitator superfamily 1 [Bacteroidota bacterium]